MAAITVTRAGPMNNRLAIFAKMINIPRGEIRFIRFTNIRARILKTISSVVMDRRLLTTYHMRCFL